MMHEASWIINLEKFSAFGFILNNLMTNRQIYNDKYVILFLKVSKGLKIRNRYNQAPHLTQDTNGKVTNSWLDITNKSQEVSISQQVTTRHI